MIGRQLEHCFAGQVLAPRLPAPRPRARRRREQFIVANVAFAARFVAGARSGCSRCRPRVLYVDIPKDGRSFLRNSGVLLTSARVARARGRRSRRRGLRVPARAVGGEPLRARAVARGVYAIRVLGEHIAATLREHGLDNAVVVSNGIDEPPGAAVERLPRRSAVVPLRRQARRGEGRADAARVHARAPGCAASPDASTSSANGRAPPSS